jgi:3-phenylpropionate/cinnamic acid dioxygenase small subunit
MQKLSVEALITRSAIALDRIDYASWLECFAEECRYEITTVVNQANGWPCGLLHAFNKDQLRDRVASIETVNVYEPHRYRHILSQTYETHTGIDTIFVTGFSVYRITANRPTILFATGEYRDRLKYEASGVSIRERTVVLDNEQIDTLLAIPL